VDNILIVDDDQDVREVLSDVVKNMGKHSITASDGREGLKRFQEHPVDLVITDLKMPEMDGTVLLKEIKRMDKDAVVIVLTGYPSIDTAVETIKEGAYDYLTKPLRVAEIEVVIERALERKTLAKSLAFFKGANWALIISVPIWLILGIILASILR